MADVRVPFNLKLIAILLVLLVIAGIAGFHFFEGWSYFDGFYMVLTTITSIGYGEIHPLSHAGRIFNSFIILTGVGLVLLLVAGASRTLLEFELQSVLGRRRMDREIGRLTGHYIICGAGRVGRSAARELAQKPLPFVIVDSNEEKLKKYSSEGWLTFLGDATQAPVLQQLRIESARGLVAATTTDATNIYIILTARALNPKLKIIARASEEEAEKHLLTAGADSIVSPYRFAGYRIAQTFMRPNVVDFFDTAMGQQRPLEIEEVKVGKGARFVGKTLEGSRIRQELGVIVLAIKGEHTPMRFNPPPDEVIHEGDHLIAMGDPDGLRKLEESASVRP
ncbi:MAG TPA: potassium channel protein [Candidatus Eisenbacteria bacterium]|nr:potassium channel protein [Candidatus Eisenbacteria bacterium]